MLVVWQTTAVALAFSSGAHAAELDAFGNPLCITSDAGHSQKPGDHSLPECCTLACNASATNALHPTPSAPVIGLRDLGVVFGEALRSTGARHAVNERSLPRGPPGAA